MDTRKKIKVELERLEEIPPLPEMAIQALNMVMDDEVDINKLSKIVESDPALCIKILDLANKAFLGVSKVKSISHMLTVLGLNVVRYALLGVIINSLSEKSNEIQKELQKNLWTHSLTVAISSSLIAEKTYPSLKTKAFICGLFHDIGKVALILFYPQKYLDFTNEHVATSDLFSIEEEYFNINHSILGKWISKKWNLPKEIEEIIYHHHQPLQIVSDISENPELIFIVKLGNIIAHDFLLDFCPKLEEKELMKILNLSEKDLGEIYDKLKGEFTEKSKLFNLHQDMLELYTQVIDKSRRKLSSISVELELQNKKLRKIYNYQSILLDFATSLINIQCYKNFFSSLNDLFQKLSHYKIGAIYILNLREKLLEASFFQINKAKIDVVSFLDENGVPIWDNNSKNFPELVKKILSILTSQVHKKFSKEILKDGVIFNIPFVFLPFNLSKFGITGEICLIMEEDRKEMDSDEKSFWLQVARMTQQCLEKIEAIKQLELKNEELTMALYKNQKIQERLFETERLASVGQLAAGVAHEINNPLAIISGRVQMIMLSESDPKRIDQLNQILQQIERITSILNRLMDFAKVKEPEFGPVNLKELLDKIIEFIKPGFDKKGISIVKNLSANIPTIKADFAQLEQVFLNLLINAKQAMEKKKEKGKVEVEVGLDKSKEFVVVKIKDEGCGIPRHVIKRVFEPFFTTKEPGKGTGLGLSTSLSIIEEHHGKILINSEEGVGTEVQVYLPININKFKSESSKKDITLNKDVSILVVDDEDFITEILKEVLSKEGMNVFCCSNGKEALELLDKKKIDIVLLDIKMPIMDGISFINILEERKFNIPIIIITGWTEDEEVKKLLKTQKYQCIRKPFHVKDILKTIHNCLIER